jgi:hypothetical protein
MATTVVATIAAVVAAVPLGATHGSLNLAFGETVQKTLYTSDKMNVSLVANTSLTTFAPGDVVNVTVEAGTGSTSTLQVAGEVSAVEVMGDHTRINIVSTEAGQHANHLSRELVNFTILTSALGAALTVDEAVIIGITETGTGTL